MGTLNALNYTFSPSRGLSLSNALPDSAYYSIPIDFFRGPILAGLQEACRFPRALTSDGSVYDLNSALNFYPVTTGPADAFQSDVEVRLIITRDGSTDEFNGYINGVLQITFTDSGDLALFGAANNIINFFNDDAATGSVEASAGLVDQIAIYDLPLTAAEAPAFGRTRRRSPEAIHIGVDRHGSRGPPKASTQICGNSARRLLRREVSLRVFARQSTRKEAREHFHTKAMLASFESAYLQITGVPEQT